MGLANRGKVTRSGWSAQRASWCGSLGPPRVQDSYQDGGFSLIASANKIGRALAAEVLSFSEARRRVQFLRAGSRPSKTAKSLPCEKSKGRGTRRLRASAPFEKSRRTKGGAPGKIGRALAAEVLSFSEARPRVQFLRAGSRPSKTARSLPWEKSKGRGTRRLRASAPFDKSRRTKGGVPGRGPRSLGQWYPTLPKTGEGWATLICLSCTLKPKIHE
jgi:hypothetical protein